MTLQRHGNKTTYKYNATFKQTLLANLAASFNEWRDNLTRGALPTVSSWQNDSGWNVLSLTDQAADCLPEAFTCLQPDIRMYVQHYMYKCKHKLSSQVFHCYKWLCLAYSAKLCCLWSKWNGWDSYLPTYLCVCTYVHTYRLTYVHPSYVMSSKSMAPTYTDLF